MIPILLKDHLIDLGVIIIGDILAFIQHAESLSQPSSEATSTTITSSVLTKAKCLKSLEDIIKHAEAFELALQDQAHLHQQTDSAAQIAAYEKSRSDASKPCSGCGTTNHTMFHCLSSIGKTMLKL